jgi:hypothetical protein
VSGRRGVLMGNGWLDVGLLQERMEGRLRVEDLSYSTGSDRRRAMRIRLGMGGIWRRRRPDRRGALCYGWLR